MKLILATRGSMLALAQSEQVQQALMQLNPEIDIELKVITTSGDKNTDVALAEIGGKGLFILELEQALLDGTVDLAVHSMKDFPTDIPEGLRIGCIPQRVIPNDVLISRSYKTLEEFPDDARIGTSSLRRSSQLKAKWPQCTIIPLRGNIDTRLRKLDEGKMDAIVLATAGLQRLGLDESNVIVIPEEIMIPAVGQGALCIEVANTSKVPQSMLDAFQHSETERCITLERAALKALSGSCHVPIGVYATCKDQTLFAIGCIASPDGTTVLRRSIEGSVQEAEALGVTIAQGLLDDGGKEILEAIPQP